MSIENIHAYMNLLARALHVVEQFSRPFNQLNTIRNYSRTSAATKAKLDKAWIGGLSSFLHDMDNLLKQIEKSPKNSRFIQADTIALWMDMMISYNCTCKDEKRFFLDELLPTIDGMPIHLNAMNTNYQETGIEIHPKFDTAKVYDMTTGVRRPRSLANRDVFIGRNGKLHNIVYLRWEKNRKVEDVILPYEYDPLIQTFRVAFAPMSDAGDLLKLSDIPLLVYEGIELQGKAVKEVRHTEQLKNRLIFDWQMACDNGVNLLFFPEMLGTDEFSLEKDKISPVLKPLALKAIKQGKTPPVATVFPSYWRDGVNSVTVVDQIGQSVGQQQKHIPFINEEEGWIEALQENKTWHVLLLHIPGVHRIAVVICAEFLDKHNENVERLVYGELCATLVLVPSYSRGEQDFINHLSSMKCYGTTVVWGDCCGAVKTKRVIGGCSIAGTDSVERFGDYCNCGNQCKGHRSCMFVVDLPIWLDKEKPSEPFWEKPVHHLLN